MRLEEEEEDCNNRKAYKREDKRPTEESVVAMFGVFESGIEAENGGVGTQLGKAGKKHGGIDHYACETNFLLSEQVGDHKEGCHSPNEDSQIVGQSAFNALFSNYTHSLFR